MCHRCPWLDISKSDYVSYHDEEWGVPVFDDRTLFEFLILESAQAGLNWYTILKRREGYSKAFANFDVNAVAKFGEQDLVRLQSDVGIIRNKLKIAAAINNAQQFIVISQQFGSFSQYLWDFVDHKVQVGNWQSLHQYPATSDISDKLSKDLKKRGFKFIGSTIVYAYLQAMGLINDHSQDCFRRQQLLDYYRQHEIDYQFIV